MLASPAWLERPRWRDSTTPSSMAPTAGTATPVATPAAPTPAATDAATTGVGLGGTGNLAGGGGKEGEKKPNPMGEKN